MALRGDAMKDEQSCTKMGETAMLSICSTDKIIE
jgi:hypothetical protein